LGSAGRIWNENSVPLKGKWAEWLYIPAFVALKAPLGSALVAVSGFLLVLF
jgi:hypothetical protein